MIELENLPQWLEKNVQNTQEYKLNYLLAHAEDGIIWGRFDQNHLTTADQVFPNLPKLRLSTLQRCRIFGQTGEVLLWRSQDTWQYRCVGNPDCEYICEKQMLWGTHKIEEKGGFTLIEDGSEGLRHAVPLMDIPFSKERNKHPLYLEVRHYIDYDNDGLARISLSRLVNLTSDL